MMIECLTVLLTDGATLESGGTEGGGGVPAARRHSG